MADRTLPRVRRWQRLVVPLALIFVGVWLLAGCIYLPLPEHRTGSGQKDFRDLVGDADSKRPLRPLAVTRAQVVAALGPPPFTSADGRAVGYTLETEGAVWLFPLCFRASSAQQRLYGLRLVFDEHDRLTSWKLIHQDRSLSWFIAVPLYPEILIQDLNAAHDGPELIWPHDPPPAASRPVTQP